MKIEDCFQLGYIVKPHGIHGALTIFLDTDNPEYYEEMESIYVEYQQKLVPFFIEFVKLKGHKATLKLQDVDGIELATQYKGCTIFPPLDMLPKLKEDQFYYHEIIGYRVIDQTIGEIGKVKNIYEANGNDLFVIDFKNKEILAPIKDKFIQKLDKKNTTIFLNLPNGLLDVYLNQ
jgi:16S rRNA processing protein RimM